MKVFYFSKKDGLVDVTIEGETYIPSYALVIAKQEGDNADIFLKNDSSTLKYSESNFNKIVKETEDMI